MRLPPLAAATLVTALAAFPASAQSFSPDPWIDRLFAQWDTPSSPGCAVGVIRDGTFVYERGYGMANLDYDIPNSPRMVYYVGSDSKQFTAAAIGLLSLQGKLGLDDDVRKYVPEMPDYRATYGVPVTIRNLVHHTSGIRDMYTLMSLSGMRLEDVMTDDAALTLIARQKELNFTPGTDYLYSNSGYWLLGQIVKRITGQSLRVYADSQIFQPLGMTHTHFHDDRGHVMKNRAMSYEANGAGGSASATSRTSTRSAPAGCTQRSRISRSGTRTTTPTRSAATRCSRSSTRAASSRRATRSPTRSASPPTAVFASTTTAAA